MQNVEMEEKPVMDFASIFRLESDDRLEGYMLHLGNIFRINLVNVEKAYLEADAAGLHAGTIVQFVGCQTVAVVTGRNLNVMSVIGAPSRCPVLLQSQRGLFEYAVSDAKPLVLPVAVEGLTNAGDIFDGLLTQARVDDAGQASVQIDGQWFRMSDLGLLERVRGH